MRIKLNSVLFTCLLACLAHVQARAASPAPFSKYGNIQNVQTYSSNPYWTPDSPYNLRMPTPVYATGTDIETAECQQVVAQLIASVCSMANNCATHTLSDIRPTLMLQLSRMPAGNYATACAGYIDTAFDTYKNTYATGTAMGTGAFPAPTAPNPNADAPNYQPTNPFTPKTPDWAEEVQERKQELENLRAASGYEPPHLERAAFPETYADLSFTERMQNATAGYEPYKGVSAYKTIKIESEEDYLARQKKREQRQNSYCQQNRQNYQTMLADLKTLESCRTRGVKFTDCKLKGTY